MQQKIHVTFIDLEKTYDRLPRQEVYYFCKSKSCARERYLFSSINLGGNKDSHKNKVLSFWGRLGFVLDVVIHKSIHKRQN